MLLYLKIKPNQRFDRVEKADEQWLIRLKAPAVDGKANEHLIDYLSNVLDIPKSKIRIKKGATNRFKCLEIDAEETLVVQRLQVENAKLHNSL